MTPPIPPLHKVRLVPWTPEATFRRFTTDLGTWWPLRTHSIGGSDATGVVFEPQVGGQLYEVHRDGGTAPWGTVLAWAPPRMARFTWHPGEPVETAGEVEIRCTAEGQGTRFELIHSGWERLGAKGRRARRMYGLGWANILDLFAGRPMWKWIPLDALQSVMTALMERKKRKVTV